MDFHTRYGPWAVIAGASEGVGASVARLLGERGINVVLIGRRKETLDEVGAAVATDTRSVELDLNRPDAAAVLADATADLEVGLLVFNAGGAGAVPPKFFLDKPMDVWQGLIARNCATVATTAYHFAGKMVERGHGGIVLVGSTSCWAGTPGLALYGATKAFQLVLAEGLWAELKPSGVDVLAHVLGMTDTPAFRRILGRPMEEAADCDVVAQEMLDNLSEGPTLPPGPSQAGTFARREAVERRSNLVTSHFH